MGVAARFLLFCVAAVLAGFSFTVNATFWQTTFAADAGRAQFFVALSICAGVIKYALAIYSEAFGVPLRKSLPLLLLFTVALVFDLTSGLGYARQSRANISAASIESETRRAAAVRDVREAEAARDALPAGRPVATVAAEHAAEDAKGECTSERAARTDRCAKVAKLKSELATATARVDAETRLAAARAALAAVPPPKDADPQATGLADLLNSVAPRFGVTVTAAQAGVMLSLLVVALLEFGPVTCFRAATRDIGDRPGRKRGEHWFARFRRPRPAPSAPPKIFVADTCPPANDETANAPRPPRAKTALDPLAVILQRPSWVTVAADGVTLRFKLADAAKAVTASKPTISRRLKALEAAGIIKLSTSAAGVAIKLLHPLKSAA